MLNMRMKRTALFAEGSGVSSTAEETMRHMWTRMEGKAMQDMTYQNTGGGGRGGGRGEGLGQARGGRGRYAEIQTEQGGGAERDERGGLRVTA